MSKYNFVEFNKIQKKFIKDGIDYSNTEWEKHKFEFVREITSGSYNKVSLYRFDGVKASML